MPITKVRDHETSVDHKNDKEKETEGEKKSETEKPSETEIVQDRDVSAALNNEVIMEVYEVDQDQEMDVELTDDSGVQNGKNVAIETDTHTNADCIETITGDQSFSEESVLKNPNVNVCIISNTSPDKRRASTENITDLTANEESDENISKTSLPNDQSVVQNATETTSSVEQLIPKSVSEIGGIYTKNIAELSASTKVLPSSRSTSGGEGVKKVKTLKILYPKKKMPLSELEIVSVPPALRDCLQCAKFTTCALKVAISGIDCYLCSKECAVEQKLLHKKALVDGVLLPIPTNGGSSDSGLEDIIPVTVNDASPVKIITPTVDNRLFNNSTTDERLCSSCSKQIKSDDSDLEAGTLQWATMDFCSEDCLGSFQALNASTCQLCGQDVSSVSLGKYSVRFGYETRQFCTSRCLEEFKKGLKACSYCQRDLNSDGMEGESIGFLAPVGDKGQFKDFCSQDCLEKYDSMSNNQPVQLIAHECAVCNKIKIVRVELMTANKTVQLCSDVCFNAFKFVNDKMKISLCNMCKKYFDVATHPQQLMYFDDKPLTFCSKTCLNVQVLSKRKICPCNWCKVKKYNFDMIRKKMKNGVFYMCSLNCLALYQVSLKASIGQHKLKCDWCGKTENANFHLTMSDASLRNFCSFECVEKFRSQYRGSSSSPGTSLLVAATSTSNTSTSSLVTTSPANIPIQASGAGSSVDFPIISSVVTLKKFDNAQRVLQKPSVVSSANVESVLPSTPVVQSSPSQSVASPVVAPQAQNVVEILVRPRSPKFVKNKITMVQVRHSTKGVMCRPNRISRSVQTQYDAEDLDSDKSSGNNAIIPVPVPIYIPAPMAMYSVPVPTLIPVPIPVPIPVFVPTTKDSAKDILESIKRIQDTFPSNPIEAELLSMAEAAAKKSIPNGIDDSSSPKLSDDEEIYRSRTRVYAPFERLTPTDDSNGADGTSQNSAESNTVDPLAVDDSIRVNMQESDLTYLGAKSVNSNFTNQDGSSGRKRLADDSTLAKFSSEPTKRRKTVYDESISKELITKNKADHNMKLKYVLGVKAWKHFWVNYNKEMTERLEDVENAKDINLIQKRLGSDLLELRGTELNQALILLMENGRLPNGESYPPATKYYLALGIQYYLMKNGRIDNLFSDHAYETFTDLLDKEAMLFQETALNGSSIVTIVEEEHLWESKQLGVHSPFVLLSTLMYLNTKYFKLETVKEHQQLCFSQIVKQKEPASSLSPASTSLSTTHDEDPLNDTADDGNSTFNHSSNRSMVLRFYPSSDGQGNNTKKEVYEQYMNKDDPSRCPVSLYEFYLSRCPESVKSRTDVFYLQPERACAPDSPVWYTNTPLSESLLKKMLNRIKMVKEINFALAEP